MRLQDCKILICKKTFQVRVYPTVWFVNPQLQEENKMNLDALGSTGYVAGGSEKWLEGANSIIKNK
jgi:protein disulfide-isomerase